MIHMKKIFVLLFLLFATEALAQFEDITVVEKEGFSSLTEKAKARQEIIDTVVEEAASEYIIRMVGAEKYRKNRRLIKAKVLRDVGRFIPIIKNGRLRKSNDEFAMTVQFQISLKNLKSILLEHGLLYRKEGLPVILPFIQVHDRVHSLNYKWWSHPPARDKALLQSLVTKAEENLRDQLLTHGFYGALPTSHGFYSLIPSVLQNERPSESAFDFFSSFFVYDIYVEGSVSIEPNHLQTDSYRVDVHWAAKYKSTHRTIAEVTRHFTTEPGSFDLMLSKALAQPFEAAAKDLTAQLKESWQKGTFGASLFVVELRGKINYPQLHHLMSQLSLHAKYFKSIRERRFEVGKITLEADVTGGPNELGQIISGTEIEGLSLKISEISSERVVVDLLAKQSSGQSSGFQ